MDQLVSLEMTRARKRLVAVLARVILLLDGLWRWGFSGSYGRLVKIKHVGCFANSRSGHVKPLELVYLDFSQFIYTKVFIIK